MDDTSDTHGVAVTSVPLPGFPQGLLVVQDGNNPRGNQISSAYPGRRYVERSGFLGSAIRNWALAPACDDPRRGAFLFWMTTCRVPLNEP